MFLLLLLINLCYLLLLDLPPPLHLVIIIVTILNIIAILVDVKGDLTVVLNGISLMTSDVGAFS